MCLALLITVTWAETLHGQGRSEAAPVVETTVKILPPVDSTATISESTRRLEQALDARVKELEQKIAALQLEEDSARSAAQRIRVLENRIRLVEERNSIDRMRQLGDARHRYTDGYKLLVDMQTLATALASAGESVQAYNSISGLTDLRQYAGFNAAFKRLTDKVKNNDERSWLDGLLTTAVPKIANLAASLAGVGPVVQAAGLALNKLQTILPAYAEGMLSGRDFVDTYNQLSCGLNAASSLHDDLATLAALNASWTAEVTTLTAEYPAMLSKYRTLVNAPADNVPDAAFYAAVQKRFDEAANLPQEDYLHFQTSVTAHNEAFKGAATRYAAAVEKHLDFWQRQKAVITDRRNLDCMQNDTGSVRRYDDAVARVDTAIAKVRLAYLFAATNRPENEYFRLVTSR